MRCIRLKFIVFSVIMLCDAFEANPEQPTSHGDARRCEKHNTFNKRM